MSNDDDVVFADIFKNSLKTSLWGGTEKKFFSSTLTRGYFIYIFSLILKSFAHRTKIHKCFSPPFTFLLFFFLLFAYDVVCCYFLVVPLRSQEIGRKEILCWISLFCCLTLFLCTMLVGRRRCSARDERAFFFHVQIFTFTYTWRLSGAFCLGSA